MAEHDLPRFRIDKNNPENGIKDLLKIIKPKWNADCIKLDPLSGGFSGKIFKAFHEDDPNDAVTVRIRDMADDFIDLMPKNLETLIIQKISQLGHFSKLHAVFENGYCYGFIQGKPMMNVRNRTGFVTEEMMRAVAKELAFVHSLDVSEYMENDAMCFKGFKDFLVYQDTDLKHPLRPTEEQFCAETVFIDEFTKKLAINTPSCVFHGDFHFGNIIWNEDKKKVFIVDWESVFIGQQHLDLTYFFETPALFQSTGKKKPDTFTYPANYNDKFLRIYYEEYCKNMNKKFTEKNLEELTSRVFKASLCMIWMFATFPLTFPKFCDTFADDIPEYFERTLKQYLQRKKEVLGYDTLEIENSKTDANKAT